MVTVERIKQLVIDSASCHCTRRNIIDEGTAYAINKISNQRNAIVKWTFKNGRCKVRIYVETDGTRYQDWIEQSDTDEQIEQKFYDLFYKMHLKITGEE